MGFMIYLSLWHNEFWPHDLRQQRAYLEKCHAGASVDCAVLNSRLVSQIVNGFNGHVHALHGEKGCQVSCVGGDDDQGKSPP